MRKLVLGLTAAAVLATGASAATVVSNQVLGTTATFMVGEIAGNSAQIGVDVKHSKFLKRNENGFWTGSLDFTATQDYQSISAPITFNFYQDFAHKNANGFLDFTSVNVYPFVNRINNVQTNNRENFGGIGLSTNLVLQYQNEKIADIEIGGEKSIFDKSTHKYANLFVKVNVPIQDNLSAYAQIGKVFLTDKTTTTKTETIDLGGGDTTTTTVTTTEPTSTTENTFLLGISYSF